MPSSNQQQMFDCILQWQQGGLSQKAWCAEKGIPYSSFHYWYKRFRNLHSPNKQAPHEGFVQLMVPDRPSGSPWCELVLGTGPKLLFHQPVSAAFIRSLLA